MSNQGYLPITRRVTKQITPSDKPDNVFKNTLLTLWLKGVDIKLELLFPDSTFNKVPLPTYGFDRFAFSLTKADDAPKPDHSEKLESMPALTPQPAKRPINVLSNRVATRET